MKWFHNLDQLDQDKILQLLCQSIQHYGNEMNENVLKDMKQKFGLNGPQTWQLYEFMYLEKVMFTYIDQFQKYKYDTLI